MWLASLSALPIRLLLQEPESHAILGECETSPGHCTFLGRGQHRVTLRLVLGERGTKLVAQN